MNLQKKNSQARSLRLIAITLLLSLIILPRAFAQAPETGASKAPAKAEPESLDPLGRDTPEGTVRGFIKAASDGNFQRAAQYLDTRGTPKQGSKRAEQLAVVLNRGLLNSYIGQLSKRPEGNLDDDLAPNLERVAVAKSGTGRFDILLERVAIRGNPPIWLFAARTLRGLPAVYEGIQPLWIERVIWPPLREIRFLDVPLWQWLGLPLAVALILVFSRLLSFGLFAVLRLLLFRLTGERAVARLAQITSPVRLVTLSIVIFIWLSFSNLPLVSRVSLARIAYALGIVGLAWLLLRLIDISGQLMEARLRRLHQPGNIAIAQLSRNLGKVVVVLIGALALLYLARIDLTAALAGLGIGGLAMAFAAQKTLENLFGGVMIISDRPVRVGDFCKVGDVLGTVEEIGLRSTRIRTLDRTVVSIPNSQMVAQNIDNYSLRDKIWFRPTLGLRYETSAEQLRFVLAEIRRMLYEHPMVETESARVRFVRFGGSSLDLEVFAYVRTGDFTRYLEVQEDLLLRIMDIIEGSGTGIAFPSSTTYLARDSGLDEEKTQEAIAAVGRWREERDLPFPNFRPERISEFDNTLEYPPADSGLRKTNDPK
jgi:MscS family membrane protein